MKTATPNGIGEQKLRRTCCYLDQKSGVVSSEAHINFDDLFPFFGDPLITVPKLVKTFFLEITWLRLEKSFQNWRSFFLEITWFWQKHRLNFIQDWWKFRPSSFTVVSSFQKSPTPLCEILGTSLSTLVANISLMFTVWPQLFRTKKFLKAKIIIIESHVQSNPV